MSAPRIRLTAALAAAAALVACSERRLPPGSVCTPGEQRCSQNAYEVCGDDGERWVVTQDCSQTSQVCLLGIGCNLCAPGSRTCDGLDVLRCGPDGDRYDRIATCDAEGGDTCHAGTCINACVLAEQSKSYEGCEYWAVDLDNAVISNQGAAAAQQFAVVLSNAGAITAEVTVEIFCTDDDADDPVLGCTPGEPYVVEGPFFLAPEGLKIVELGPREVDGSSHPALNDGPGTYRSRHAFRISSTAPLIAYQFNPLENVNVFSNDASLLLPTASLGTRYLVLSWPQTLAVTDESETNAGIDLRAFLTIVGIHDDTSVQVRLTTDILGGADIPAAFAGDLLELSLDRYEVINLETDGFDADFTGTFVQSQPGKPVAVFAGSEASDVPRFDSLLYRQCCADHLEQQLFPESAFGTRYVAVKTPLRSAYVSDAGWNVALVPDEPEWWRVLATREDTVVSTNLPPPNNTFFLQRGQSAIFKSERDFVLWSTAPVSFAQFPGGQQTTGIPSTLPGGERPPGGDPSFILIPPVEQWRDRYLFLVPNKYAFDFLLIAAPITVELTYDGVDLSFALDCEYEPIGTLEDSGETVEYMAIRCPLSYPTPDGDGLQDDGVHLLESTNGDPFGLVVYGWDSYVSYGYPGGANVALINIE